MTTGARTPEELDPLLEDAFVLRNGALLGQLFDSAAIMADRGSGWEARGGEAIERAIGELWAAGGTYVARRRRVLQARDTALVVGDGAVHVARRGPDGTWRAAISLLELHPPNDEQESLMTQDTHLLEPTATHNGEGEALWWFGCLAEIKLTAAQTGGLMSIIEITEAPNAEAPLHVHHGEDEAFWVIEGDVTFEVGDATIHASAGDFAFGPRDIPHRYTVGDAGCRMLFILTPGGMEDLVRDMSVPAQTRTLPPPSDDEPDWDHVAAVAKAHGCELLG